MIVMKFGGSSVGSRSAIARVANIIKQNVDKRPLVVVSAMGKSTNRLLELAHFAGRGDKGRAELTLTELRNYTLSEGGSVNGAVEELFDELKELVGGLLILGEVTPRTLDTFAAFGERISSLILAEALRRAGCDAIQYDARSVLVTDDNFTLAAPHLEETRRRAQEQIIPILQKQIVVVGGFIGSTTEGVTTTLGRGGSDYSASIFGAACSAEEIQIWTDVDGMLTCDPRISNIGRRIKRLSFGEASELAYFGAKVLHPSTVLPAVEENIPVRILNSGNPESSGTLITSNSVPSANCFKAIACKRGISSVHIYSTRMLMAHGFLRKIFEVFDRERTPVDLIATSEVSVSITVDNEIRLPQVVAELSEFSEVKVEDHQAIISLVGEGTNMRSGILARVFNAVKNVNVRMVSQGASNLNISFVIADKDVPAAVEALHREFFTEVDANVFH